MQCLVYSYRDSVATFSTDYVTQRCRIGLEIECKNRHLDRSLSRVLPEYEISTYKSLLYQFLLISILSGLCRCFVVH
jgi:hypothetical protein